MRVLGTALVAAGWVVLVGGAGAQTLVRRPVQGGLVDGQAAYAAPLATQEQVLEEMSGRAAVIFAGTVTAVRPSEGVVEVEFAVAQGVRGAATGSVYVVREWAGLWRDGPRFQVGQRRLMLLYAPGPGGLSSPVDGMDGAIPVSGGGVEDAAMNGAGGVVAGNSVDMRWLQARTLRTTAAATVVTTGAATGAAPADSAIGRGRVASVVAATGPEGQPELGHVVGFLKGLETGRHASR